jgi:hypothetical protein
LAVSSELQARGFTADAMHLQIKSNLDSAVSLNALPVDIVVDTQGVFQSNLAGRLWIDALAKKLTVEQLAASAKAKQLKPVVGLQLDNASMDVHLSGFWQPDKFELNVTEPSQFSADILAPSSSIAAKSARFSTAQLNVSGDIRQGEVLWPQLTFTTDALISGGIFHHPQINAKAWSWRGKAQGSLADFDAAGDLGVGSSLVVKYQLRYFSVSRQSLCGYAECLARAAVAFTRENQC